MMTIDQTAFDGVDDLLDGGALSQKLDGYSERPAQIEMARMVAHAIDNQHHAVIEAGTGTGKSHAYLLPTARSGKKAVISTANKALQDQLFGKDIRFIQENVTPVTAVLMKGMGNYLCRDRWNEYQAELLPEDEAVAGEMLAMLKDAVSEESCWDGDFETLKVEVPSSMRSAINADSDRCIGNKCKLYQDCFYYGMRERAAKAKLLFVNHALLMRDVVTGGHLLPKHDVVIIDEAHCLPDEATSAFTVTVSEKAVTMLLNLKEVQPHLKEKQSNELQDLTQRTWGRLDQLMQGAKGSKVVLSESIEAGLKLSSEIEKLAAIMENALPTSLDEKVLALHNKTVKRCENLAANLRTVFSRKDTRKYVYYLEKEAIPGKRHPRILAHAAPLTVSDQLCDTLFSQHDKPVICTSATLATPKLDFFTHQVGLDQIRRNTERVLPLVFDFARQALLYLPRRIPEPAYSGEDEVEYQQAISAEMLKLVRASRGRAFLLFSSRRGMDTTYNMIAEEIRSAGYPTLRQGDMPRSEMTKRFRETPGSVLFGMKSFWEGVDITGEALSLVVIDKLPFVPPDDPVQKARVDLMDQTGGKWQGFQKIAIPATTLQLKQGVGRLIRTHTDRGVMAILDSRMHSKAYGKTIVQAMPPAKVVTSILDVQKFFDAEEPSGYCACGAEVEMYIPDEWEPSGLRACCAAHC